MALTEKQLRFCHEYALDFNGTQSYLRAYPDSSEKAAAVGASRLLRNAKVQRTLGRLLQRRQEAVEVSAESVLTEVSKLAFADVRELVDDDGNLRQLRDLPPEVAASLASFSLTDRDGQTALSSVRLADRTSALSLLAKHLGMLQGETHRHLHAVAIFTPDVIATMTDGQLTRLESAQSTMVTLQKELGLVKSR